MGIDPGKTGAVVVVRGDEILHAEQMPVGARGNKRQIDSQELADLLWYASKTYEVRGCVVEEVMSMPHDGHVGAFSFGDSYGVCRGILAGLAIDTKYVRPQAWRRFYGITGGGKAASLELARGLFKNSGEYITLKKHHGRAEAALLAGLWQTIVAKR